jgi:putative transposase
VARTKSIDLSSAFQELLPATEIRGRAKYWGAFVRIRKIDPFLFVLSLVLGFALGPERTLAGLRRAFLTVAGGRLAPSAFYSRFSARLVELMADIAAKVVERAAGGSHELVGPFGALAGLIAVDSTILRLRDLLADAFPGSRTNHSKAAAKVHAVMSATAWGASIKITAGRCSDVRTLTIGRWVKNKLLLLDCGYFSYGLFESIRLQQGFFVVPLPAKVNPLIQEVAIGPRKAAGRKLRETVAGFSGTLLDIDGLATYHRANARPRVGARRSGVFRYIGVRNEETGELWLCATNLPRESFSAQAVASIYRARWLVELLFKSLKNDLNMDHLGSTKAEVVQSLIYASVIGWAVTNALREEFAAKAAEARRITPQRWGRLFREFAPFLLMIAAAPHSRLATLLAPQIERVLRAEAYDPHRRRRSTLERATSGQRPRKANGRRSRVA